MWHKNHPEALIKQHEKAVLDKELKTEKVAAKEAAVGA